MAATYQLLLNGQAADPELYTAIASLEVEESMDMPGAVQLSLPVNATDAGDYAYVSDARFQPLSNLAVVATPGDDSSSSGLTGLLGGNNGASGAQCIFDGYILSHKLHLDRGTTNSTLTIWGQDASWLMNLEEKTREWVDVTDADVANSIFNDYGITPADENTQDDSPSHTEAGHSLMQRGSDIQFLRMLARRNGKVCRVTCADQPGQRTGYFAKPNLSAGQAAILSLNDPQQWTINGLDLHWDATRPTAVIARQALFTNDDPGGATGDTTDSGLALLGDRGLADFTGKPLSVLLAAPVDDAGELSLRAQALLRESLWFVKCQCEADLARLGGVLRAGSLVQLQGAGSLHSGSYLVWRMRHTITPTSYKMKIDLVRDAVGAATQAGTGGLAGVLGQASISL
jgi:phage protein D